MFLNIVTRLNLSATVLCAVEVGDDKTVLNCSLFHSYAGLKNIYIVTAQKSQRQLNAT